ncbi:hypothetical protein PILCRDRAFT_828049 [Piloderma croceum F 1598]|uniref:Cytochrome P450 n=1 Tax=Piloderma croceum (strain F 1598) TaxID=765440 RepID=A0A0C3EPZ8_PILCF|nr:hypothetical protein PILCRDRAFT_828049 [Piloderma croceum F 1598]
MTFQYTQAALSSLLLCLGISYVYLFPGIDAAEIHTLRGFSIVNAWTFLNKRYDFLRSNFEKTGHNLFAFKIMQHKVIAISGDEARKIFFNNSGLNSTDGAMLLRGGIPVVKDVKADIEEFNLTELNKRLLKIVHRGRFKEIMPTLFNDIHERMEDWGSEGKMSPFKDIYELVFLMTVRMASCQELANDPAMIRKMRDLYWKLEKSATPVGLLFPWFPGTAKKNKEQAINGLYEMLSHYVDLRREADVPSLDAIDVLIADGMDNSSIIQVIMSMVFAGFINTGMISSWVLVYLGTADAWKDRAIAEIQSLIDAHANTTFSEPIHRRLSAIPISAWEDEMPVTESIIRETLRIVGNPTLFRRNFSDDFRVCGKTIDKGAFMTYNIADVHLNERFYSNPLKFDPGRFNVAGEDRNAPFLAWGTGRHPCTGMKTAKLEIKMIVALVLCRYDYKLVDGSGKPVKPPQVNMNDNHQRRPKGEPCFIEYRKVAE